MLCNDNPGMGQNNVQNEPGQKSKNGHGETDPVQKKLQAKPNRSIRVFQIFEFFQFFK